MRSSHRHLISLLVISLLAGVVVIGAGTAASAQDIIIEGDAPLLAPETEVVIDDDVEIVEQPPGVYEWADLGAIECGEYRYWTGVYCADARAEPPLP